MNYTFNFFAFLKDLKNFAYLNFAIQFWPFPEASNLKVAADGISAHNLSEAAHFRCNYS